MWATAEGFSNEASISTDSTQSKRVASQSTNLKSLLICVDESGRLEMEESLGSGLTTTTARKKASAESHPHEN